MRAPARGEPLDGDAGAGRRLAPVPTNDITYRMNTWDHGRTVLDQPGRFAMFSGFWTAAAATRSSSQSPLSPSA
jgi:hypothetical protein